MQVGVLLAVLARLYHAGPLQAAAVATRVHRELHRVDDQRRRAQVIDQLINQSINRSIDQLIYLSIYQSINISIKPVADRCEAFKGVH